MNLKNSIDESNPCVLVEGPTWADADFYGKWLRAAAKADEVWKKAKEKPGYKKQIERVPKNYHPSFGLIAIQLIAQLPNDSFCTIVDLTGREREMRGWFLTMRLMGFFSLAEKRYAMRIPHRLSMGGVKNDVLAGIVLMNDGQYQHPKYPAPTMTYAEAKAWQMQLREMGKKTLH